MSEKTKIDAAPVAPVAEPVAPAVAPAEPKAEPKKEGTIGEALETTPKTEPKEETVPLAALLEVKNANKELQREMKELKKTIEGGASRTEVAADIKALTEKYPDTDPEFFKDLVKTIRSEAKQEAEAEVESKMKPVLEKDRADKIDKAFKTHFDKAMEAMPEYSKIVSEATIKALSLLPANANKTFTQLIEESYGHLVTDKKSIDAGSRNAGRDTDGTIDQARMDSDPEYFKQVMANPTLKKKYNDGMNDRIASHL